MMKTANVLALALLTTALGVAPAFGTPGGDTWVPAQESDQVAIATELNADLTSNDGQQHPASCFGMYQLRGHMNIASVSIRPTAKPALCGSAKDFGVYVVRKVNGHWTVLATSTGKPGGTCTYVAKPPAKIATLLTKLGPCYGG